MERAATTGGGYKTLFKPLSQQYQPIQCMDDDRTLCDVWLCVALCLVLCDGCSLLAYENGLLVYAVCDLSFNCNKHDIKCIKCIYLLTMIISFVSLINN